MKLIDQDVLHSCHYMPMVYTMMNLGEMPARTDLRGEAIEVNARV